MLAQKEEISQNYQYHDLCHLDRILKVLKTKERLI